MEWIFDILLVVSAFDFHAHFLVWGRHSEGHHSEGPPIANPNPNPTLQCAWKSKAGTTSSMSKIHNSVFTCYIHRFHLQKSSAFYLFQHPHVHTSAFYHWPNMRAYDVF